MPGPTGFIDQYDFQQLIKFDEAYTFRIPSRHYLTHEISYGFIFSTHYFLDGVEVGYYINCFGAGFIFEKPRFWGWYPAQRACHFLAYGNDTRVSCTSLQELQNVRRLNQGSPVQSS